MCTVVILRRPGHEWPLLLATNRDEMAERPWQAPGRHWQEREYVVAGRDLLAGGTWLGLNDYGSVAAISNREGSLGPSPDKRTRGELVLEALDHGNARDAGRALADIDVHAYRPFNMVIMDSRDAFWLRHAVPTGDSRSTPGRVEVMEIPPGISMITALDRNDMRSPRIRAYLPRFEAAKAPDPEADDWEAWERLMSSRAHDAKNGPDGAMCVVTETNYGTLSSSLIALPAPNIQGRKPVWRFCAGRPGESRYEAVAL